MDDQMFTSLKDINGNSSNFVEHIVITRDEVNSCVEQSQLELCEPPHSLLRYFQYSRGEPVATCRTCQKQIKRTQGNTNGMSKHLMRHPNIFEEFSTAKSARLPTSRMLKNEYTTPLKKSKIKLQSDRDSEFVSNGIEKTAFTENATCDGLKEQDETIIDLTKPPQSLLRYYQYGRGDPSATCRICQKRISRKKGNTKGTTRHLMLHPSFFKQFAIAKNVEIPVMKPKREINPSKSAANQNKNTTVKIEKWEQNTAKSKKMDDAILRFICLSSQPLSITEQESFSDMFSLACPNYSIKNRDYMTTLMNKKFQARYSSLKDALSKCQSCSFTTSIGQFKGQYFLSVTCHFIDDSFNQIWKVLGAEPIHGEHTSNSISNKINEIFIDFGISPSQVHIFLRDAASSMCRAVEGLKFRHFDCFLHKLALAVSDGSNLPEIAKQIQICRELVAFYNWSSAFQNALSMQQQLLDAPHNPLIGEIQTQWTSTLTMTRRVIEQQHALLAVSLDFQDVVLPNFELLKKILNILQPFENKTNSLSNRNECISSVLPSYKYLLNCLAENPCDSLEERSFKTAISDGLRSRMDSLVDKNFLVLATLLDARYKNQANIFDSDERIRNKALLCSTILPDLDSEQRQNLQKHAFDETEMSEFLTGFQEIDCIANTTTSTVEYSTVEEEVESYLQSSIERIGADPLDYWRKAANSNSYPNLRRLARIFLSAPPSSAESGRAVLRLTETESFRELSSSGENGQQSRAQMFLHFNYDN